MSLAHQNMLDGSPIKELKLNNSDAAAKPKKSEIGRINVTGYDIHLPLDDVVSALRKHFDTCGEITDVYTYYESNNLLHSHAFIYFMGEGAVDKALQLNGSDVGGWKVIARNLPFAKSSGRSHRAYVKGYDTSAGKCDLELRQHFSSCGEVEYVHIHKSIAILALRGEGAEDKVLELNGSYMGGRKLSVRLLSLTDKVTSVHKRVKPGHIWRGRPLPIDDKKPKKAKTTAE